MIRLLEVTHGQWLYRNLHVHDAVAGVNATARKEEIQRFIEDQVEMGEEGLDERDHFLLEINLEDLETTSGEEQQYWLLQIEAARRDMALRGDTTRTMLRRRTNEGARRKAFSH